MTAGPRDWPSKTFQRQEELELQRALLPKVHVSFSFQGDSRDKGIVTILNPSLLQRNEGCD